MSSINLPVRVSLAERESITPDTYCEICGSNQWFLRAPRWNTKGTPVNAPCTWVKSDGTTAYAHAGPVLLAAIFKYTIKGQSISPDFQRISDENDQHELANRTIYRIHYSNLGKEFCTKERLECLVKSTKKKYGYEALEMLEGVDIVQAFSWMRGEDPFNSSSSDDSSDEEIPLDSLSDREEHLSDSDDDAFVDW